MLRAAGFDVTASADVRRDIWYKLWGNMTINPVAAITGAPTDRVLDDPLVLAFCSAAMREASQVGAAIGCAIEQQPEDRHAITRKLGSFRPSMLQDVEAGRTLELDAIVGVVREIAQRVGVADAEHRCAARHHAPVRAHARALSGSGRLTCRAQPARSARAGFDGSWPPRRWWRCWTASRCGHSRRRSSAPVASASAASAAQAAPAPIDDARDNAVVVNHRTIVTFRAHLMGRSPRERAIGGATAVKLVLQRGGPGQVAVWQGDGMAGLQVDGVMVFYLLARRHRHQHHAQRGRRRGARTAAARGGRGARDQRFAALGASAWCCRPRPP